VRAWTMSLEGRNLHILRRDMMLGRFCCLGLRSRKTKTGCGRPFCRSSSIEPIGVITDITVLALSTFDLKKGIPGWRVVGLGSCNKRSLWCKQRSRNESLDLNAISSHAYPSLNFDLY